MRTRYTFVHGKSQTVNGTLIVACFLRGLCVSVGFTCELEEECDAKVSIYAYLVSTFYGNNIKVSDKVK